MILITQCTYLYRNRSIGVHWWCTILHRSSTLNSYSTNLHYVLNIINRVRVRMYHPAVVHIQAIKLFKEISLFTQKKKAKLINKAIQSEDSFCIWPKLKSTISMFYFSDIIYLKFFSFFVFLNALIALLFIDHVEN